MNRITKQLPALASAFLLVAATGAVAQTAQPAGTKSAYVTDQRNEVVRNSTGLCWRTGHIGLMFPGWPALSVIRRIGTGSSNPPRASVLTPSLAYSLRRL